MSAIIVPIDRALPCVLNRECTDQQLEQRVNDRWLFEPSSDSPGLTVKEYRQGLAMHGELLRFLQSGRFSVASNLKMMRRLFRLHQEMRAALDGKGMA